MSQERALFGSGRRRLRMGLHNWRAGNNTERGNHFLELGEQVVGFGSVDNMYRDDPFPLGSEQIHRDGSDRKAVVEAPKFSLFRWTGAAVLHIVFVGQVDGNEIGVQNSNDFFIRERTRSHRRSAASTAARAELAVVGEKKDRAVILLRQLFGGENARDPANLVEELVFPARL